MAEPKRIQRKRTKGWRMPEGVVYVGRPGDFENPYRIVPDGTGWMVVGNGMTHSGFIPFTRLEAAILAVEEFRRLYPPGSNNAYQARIRLRGHDLACWCGLNDPCHGDVLLEIANAPSGAGL